MIGLGAFLTCTVGIFAHYSEWTETFDYLAYVCPCIAAGVAGGAFYMGDRSKDKAYFFWSLVLLLIGLLSYAIAHKNTRPFILSSVLLATFFCWAGFVTFVVLSWRTFSGYGKVVRIGFIVALLGIAVMAALAARHEHLLDREHTKSACSAACCEPTHNQGPN